MKSRLSKRKTKPPRRKKWLWAILIPTALVAIYLVFVAQKSLFTKDANLTIAVARSDGSVDVVVVNPVAETMTTITIPGDTQVVAARGLGTWRIKSIWKLGQQEGLSGQLLAQTVTKTFNFPTEAWADEAFVGNPLTAQNTNLSLLDRVKLAVFVGRVKAASRSYISLEKSSALSQTKLVDGEVGYKLTGKTPASILAIFGETNISKEGFLVTIEDATGVAGMARQAGEVIEVLGAKVAAISESEDAVEGCVVIGPKSVTVEKIGKILSCKRQIRSESETGVRVILGRNFGEHF